MGWVSLAGPVLAVLAIPPLEVPVWAPLDDRALGSEVAGGMEEQGAGEQHLQLWHTKRRRSYAHYAREDQAVRWHQI